MNEKPSRKDFSTYHQYAEAKERYKQEKKIEKALEIEGQGRFEGKTNIQKLGILLKEKKRLEGKARSKIKRKKGIYAALLKAASNKSKQQKIRKVRVKLPEKASYFSGGYLRR